MLIQFSCDRCIHSRTIKHTEPIAVVDMNACVYSLIMDMSRDLPITIRAVQSKVMGRNACGIRGCFSHISLMSRWFSQ